MVELVPSSDTLRKIQVEYGVTGSFKDKPLAEWLRKYNPAEDEYDKVHGTACCSLPLYSKPYCSLPLSKPYCSLPLFKSGVGNLFNMQCQPDIFSLIRVP